MSILGALCWPADLHPKQILATSSNIMHTFNEIGQASRALLIENNYFLFNSFHLNLHMCTHIHTHFCIKLEANSGSIMERSIQRAITLARLSQCGNSVSF